MDIYCPRCDQNFDTIDEMFDHVKYSHPDYWHDTDGLGDV